MSNLARADQSENNLHLETIGSDYLAPSPSLYVAANCGDLLIRHVGKSEPTAFKENVADYVSPTVEKDKKNGDDGRLITRTSGHNPYLFLQPLQEWEGYVIDIQKELFSARLIDLTAEAETEEEEVEFQIEELSDANRKLLKMGAIFRWVIGYQRDKSGSKRRVSQIVFRRIPAWTKKDLIRAGLRAQEMKAGVEWS